MKSDNDPFRRGILVAAVVAGFGTRPGSLLAQPSEPEREAVTFSGHGGWPTGLHGPVKAMAFSPDGKRIASGGQDRVVRVWNAVDGRELMALRGHCGHIGSVKFSPDGKWLASGSFDPFVKIWDATSGKEVRSIFCKHSQVQELAFSSDGKRIATVAVQSRMVKVWDVASGEAVFALEGHGWLDSIAFSPNGKWLAAGCHDGTVQLWDAKTGRESRVLEGHRDGAYVRGLSFSPDGKQLADASVDGTVKVWDVERGREIVSMKVGGMLFGVTFSPNGKRLATCSSNANVSEWDVASGRKTLSLTALADYQTAKYLLNDPTPSINYIYSVAYRPDGVQLAACSSEGLVRVWNLKPIR